jgi:hypothetical protein
MPSTFSPSLKLELIGNGEQAGLWGTTTNNNLGTLLEQAIAGVEPITLTGGDYTLTNFNGLSDEARNAVLVLGGSIGAPCNVIAPAATKTYIVRNFSGATVTIKSSSGNGVALTNAASAIVFCDGLDFYSATTLNFIDGNLTVTGNATVSGSLTANTGSFTSILTVPEINERTTITGTGAGATVNFDTLTQTVLYYSAASTANSTVNIRGNSGTTLNSLMSTGQSTCVALFITNTGTAYYPSTIRVDGTTVTPLWQGGIAPTGGNTNSVDVYSFNVIKTANASFLVFASQTQFA